MTNADNGIVASSTVMPSTSPQPDMRSAAAWIVSEGQDAQEDFLAALTEAELFALPWIFEFWAMPHQLPPEGDWRAWVILGGRGAGKTRAGAEWVRWKAIRGAGRIALVGPTLHDVREVMIDFSSVCLRYNK